MHQKWIYKRGRWKCGSENCRSRQQGWKMREWNMQEQIAGVENAGVDNGEVRRYGKMPEQKTLYQESMLKRSGLKRSLDNAHEQRPGVHIQAVYLLTVWAVEWMRKALRYAPAFFSLMQIGLAISSYIFQFYACTYELLVSRFEFVEIAKWSR